MIHINHSGFEIKKLESMDAIILNSVARQIVSIRKNNKKRGEIEKLNKALFLVTKKYMGLFKTTKDIINYEPNNKYYKDNYYIEEYIEVSKFYHKAKTLFRTGDLEKRRDFIVTFLKFYSRSNDNILKCYKTINHISKNNSFEEEISSREKFKTLITEKIFFNLILLNQNVREVFNYYKHISPLRKKLLSIISLEICPYCNKGTLDINIKKKTADLDHFYTQGSLPLLALTLNNFVPSCTDCNRTFKGSTFLDISNPRYEGFDEEVVITTNYIKTGILYMGYKEIPKINVKFKVSGTSIKSQRVQASIKLFELEGRYNHSDTKRAIKDIYDKTKEINKNRKEFLQQYSTENIEQNQHISNVYGFDITESIINIRYGKLTLDILKELDFI